MSVASAFVSPFHDTGSRLFASSSTVHPSRKRKRRISKALPEDEVSCEALAPVRLDGEQQMIEQLRLAGLSLTDPIPGGNFPHAATPVERSSDLMEDDLTLAHEHREHIEVDQDTSLKRQHLAVLTAIMHKCLLDGDYVRAGRAWGNLLRAEVKGKPMNLRKNSMWGVGAEILLRKYSSPWIQGAEDTIESPTAVPSTMSNPTFSREGFEQAKEYYERLILQYPHRQWVSDAVSVLHFYPAMFGLWIFQVQSEQKAALAEVREAHSQSLDGVESSSSSSNLDHTDGRDRIRERSLLEAEQIAHRLDELLFSLPYSEDPGLWRLRAMVALWLRDLCAAGLDAESLGLESMPSTGGGDLLDDSRNLDSVYQHSAEKTLLAHQEKAQQAFEKAEALTASVELMATIEEPEI